MSSRAHISLKTKLASALLTIVRPNDRGELEPVIDFESAKKMTADEIIARFDFDHGHFHAWGGSDHPANLTPRPIMEHRTKTAKVDVPTIAKSKRIVKAQEEFRRKMLAKSGQGEPEHINDVAERVIGKAKVRRNYRWPSRKIPSRPFPKGRRPMRSR